MIETPRHGRGDGTERRTRVIQVAGTVAAVLGVATLVVTVEGQASWRGTLPLGAVSTK